MPCSVPGKQMGFKAFGVGPVCSIRLCAAVCFKTFHIFKMQYAGDSGKIPHFNQEIEKLGDQWKGDEWEI